MNDLLIMAGYLSMWILTAWATVKYTISANSLICDPGPLSQRSPLAISGILAFGIFIGMYWFVVLAVLVCAALMWSAGWLIKALLTSGKGNDPAQQTELFETEPYAPFQNHFSTIVEGEVIESVQKR